MTPSSHSKAGLLKFASEPPPAPAPPPKPKLNTRNATLAGLLPGIGPAIYGARQSADGDRTANALKLGLSSLAGGSPGGIMSQLAARRGHGKLADLALLVSLLGSAGTSGFAADRINKSAFDISALGAKVQQGANGIKERLGNIQVRPLDPMGGALAGGAGGAVLGGVGGLLKALLDSEDDGVMGTLRKALGGAAVGGAAGAGLGGGYAAMNRQRLLRQVPEKNYGAIREIMSGYNVPLKSQINRILGGNPAAYEQDIVRNNMRSGFSQAASPFLVKAIENKANTAQRA